MCYLVSTVEEFEFAMQAALEYFVGFDHFCWQRREEVSNLFWLDRRGSGLSWEGQGKILSLIRSSVKKQAKASIKCQCICRL